MRSLPPTKAMQLLRTTGAHAAALVAALLLLAFAGYAAIAALYAGEHRHVSARELDGQLGIECFAPSLGADFRVTWNLDSGDWLGSDPLADQQLAALRARWIAAGGTVTDYPDGPTFLGLSTSAVCFQAVRADQRSWQLQ